MLLFIFSFILRPYRHFWRLYILKKRLLLFFTMVFAAVLLISCGTENEDNDGGNAEGSDQTVENKGTIKLGVNNWADYIAVTNMWKVLLEEQGYEVELHQLEKGPVWTGLAQGDLDIAAQVWLPTMDEPYYNEYKDKVELKEIWYEDVGMGLTVPTYVDIDSLEQLNDHADSFDDRIVGIDAGASVMHLTKEAIEEYGLEYELIESSEPAMLSELEKAYENEELIVVTLWNPHWVFSDYDLKYLEDPKLVYGEGDDSYFATRVGFEDDHPEVVQWMNNWKMDDDSLGELMALGLELGDPLEAAKQWIEENRALVDEWMQ